MQFIILIVVIINLVDLKATRGHEMLVVGGSYSKIEDFAFSAFLYIECKLRDGTHYYMCGASIVNQAILLTSGHCFEECMPKTVINAHIGNAHRLKGPIHLISKFKIHKYFKRRTMVNDIALLKLKDKLKFGKRVQRVALMPKPPYFEPAIVTGWGNIDEVTNKSSDWLKHTTQKVWHHQECRVAGMRLPHKTFCAGPVKGIDNYPTLGDSGGPLVVRKLIQIGLVSFRITKGSKCLVAYTDVGLHFKWIKKKAKKLYCSRT